MRSQGLNAVVVVLGLAFLWGSQLIPAQAPRVAATSEPASKPPEPLPPPLQLPAESPPDLILPSDPKSAGPPLPLTTIPSTPKPSRTDSPGRPPAFRVLVPTDRDDPYLVRPPSHSSTKITTNYTPVAAAAQIPALTLEKIGPSAIRGSEPFTYEIVVRNVGTSPSGQLRVEDELPPSTRFLGAVPIPVLDAVEQGAPTGRVDRLVWTLQNLAAGAEKRFKVEVQPTGAAEWKGQATLSVTVSCGVPDGGPSIMGSLPRTSPTPARVPPLAFQLSGPKNITHGHAAMFQLQVSNNSDRAIDSLLVHVEMPTGLEHLHGSAIEAELGGLPAGQSRQVPLEVYATKPGRYSIDAWVVTNDRQKENVHADVAVSESALHLRQSGPVRLTQDGNTEYRIEVINRDKIEARKVMVTNFLPEGLELVNISDGGIYQATTRSVQWSLGTIGAGQARAVTLKMAGRTAGAFVNRILAQAENGLEARWHTVLRVLPGSPDSGIAPRQPGRMGR